MQTQTGTLDRSPKYDLAPMRVESEAPQLDPQKIPSGSGMLSRCCCRAINTLNSSRVTPGIQRRDLGVLRTGGNPQRSSLADVQRSCRARARSRTWVMIDVSFGRQVA